MSGSTLPAVHVQRCLHVRGETFCEVNPKRQRPLVLGEPEGDGDPCGGVACEDCHRDSKDACLEQRRHAALRILREARIEIQEANDSVLVHGGRKAEALKRCAEAHDLIRTTKGIGGVVAPAYNEAEQFLQDKVTAICFYRQAIGREG